MIKTGTNLKVIDNSGAIKTLCIQLLKNLKKRVGRAGDSFICTVKRLRKAIPKKKAKAGSIYLSILITTCKEQKRLGGSFVKMLDNNSILMNSSNGLPLSKRINGPVFFEVRSKGHLRLVQMSRGVV
jgi:ribosomal protein L14